MHIDKILGPFPVDFLSSEWLNGSHFVCQFWRLVICYKDITWNLCGWLCYEQEPIAFLGGMFAGLLRLDLNEEPLKDWVAKTAEAAGIDINDNQAVDSDDSIPEDIQID